VRIIPDGHLGVTGSYDKTAAPVDVSNPSRGTLDRLRAWVRCKPAKVRSGVSLRELTTRRRCGIATVQLGRRRLVFTADYIGRWHRAQAAEADAARQCFASVFSLQLLTRGARTMRNSATAFDRATTALKSE